MSDVKIEGIIEIDVIIDAVDQYGIVGIILSPTQSIGTFNYWVFKLY